jgi:UDP-galactopyranose mutase
MADHPNIEVRLETDFFDVADEFKGKVPIVYTGPVDEYFGQLRGPTVLAHGRPRGAVEDVDDFQGTAWSTTTTRKCRSPGSSSSSTSTPSA